MRRPVRSGVVVGGNWGVSPRPEHAVHLPHGARCWHHTPWESRASARPVRVVRTRAQTSRSSTTRVAHLLSPGLPPSRGSACAPNRPDQRRDGPLMVPLRARTGQVVLNRPHAPSLFYRRPASCRGECVCGGVTQALGSSPSVHESKLWQKRHRFVSRGQVRVYRQTVSHWNNIGSRSCLFRLILS